ncbi:YcgN family cysteine cluster protein [Rhodobacteraceae bacterium F11138]|nr:YcgN family cysteine cluster protein [Rhodobacteraceae bacterium F11138]
MSDPIDRSGLSDRFWERKPLGKLSQQEWEALCDGCGKCCLNKLEDEETGDVALTRVACRLLDDSTCRCSQYDIRHQFVPECIVLTPENLSSHAYWMPSTCAYRLLYEGQPLFDWHPLISGSAQSVHDAQVSVQGWTIPEFEVPEEEWEEHIIVEPI